jgi:hypothetical protein
VGEGYKMIDELELNLLKSAIQNLEVAIKEMGIDIQGIKKEMMLLRGDMENNDYQESLRITKVQTVNEGIQKELKEIRISLVAMQGTVRDLNANQEYEG